MSPRVPFPCATLLVWNGQEDGRGGSRCKRNRCKSVDWLQLAQDIGQWRVHGYDPSDYVMGGKFLNQLKYSASKKGYAPRINRERMRKLINNRHNPQLLHMDEPQATSWNANRNQMAERILHSAIKLFASLKYKSWHSHSTFQ
jgi:hypothetical protein